MKPYLYVMSDGQRSKIGISIQPNFRAKAHGKTAGSEMAKLRLWRSDDAIAIEASIKRQLKGRRAFGREWFKMSAEELIEIATATAASLGIAIVDADWGEDEVKTGVHVRFEPDELVALDEWRRSQKVIPTRPEAIRELIRRGLAAEKETDR